MTKINIIIIGAATAATADSSNIQKTECTIERFNNFKKWNTNTQADYFDILFTINTIKERHLSQNVKVYCIDPMYNFNTSDNDIVYHKDHFNIGDTQFCTRKGHNIFIEFCNLLDEYYVTKDCYEHPILKYNNYKISWISCGCSWTNKFPTDLIMKLVEEHIYTPTDIRSYDSYMYAKDFNALNDNILFQPYCQGLYQILGTFLWRGSKENNQYEHVLLELMPQIMNDLMTNDDDIKDDVQRFISQQIRWNALHRKTREKINSLVYGKYITLF